MSAARIVIFRIIQLFLVMIAIISIVFVLQRLIPGSPADVLLGPDTPLNEKEAWLKEYGFDAPLFEQYKRYMTKAIQLDFGQSFFTNRPVFELIWSRLPRTFLLAGTAFSCSLLTALLLGILASAFHGQWIDRSIGLLTVLAISAPPFLIGPVLMWVFSVSLGWLPLLGSSAPFSWVLPTCSLGFALAALTSRMIRSGIVEVMQEDYIRTAKAKGLSPFQVLFKHALPNALLPTITILGLQLGVLLSGAVITENIFAWPGLGSLTIEAVQSRDYNLVSACVAVMAFVYVASNAAVDLLHMLFDPRLKT